MNARAYWCHSCKREFSKPLASTQFDCPVCHDPFTEEISIETHPQNYIPFSSIDSTLSETTSSSLVSLVLIPRNLRGIESNFVLSAIANSFENNESSAFDSVLNYIMNNDPNNYGNPPASKQFVSKQLKQYKISKAMQKRIPQEESSCSVCKEELKLKESIMKMPCKHLFHKQCLMPWLKQRNSCPTCRYELPTDDKDYENRKKQKANQNVV